LGVSTDGKVKTVTKILKKNLAKNAKQKAWLGKGY
jgi:hypothetical protein